MTKELLQQALDALIVAREAVDFHSSGLYQISAAISAIKAQQEQPTQEASATWTEMVVANLVREGVNKHRARELAAHFLTLPTQPALSDDEIWQFWCNRPEVPEGEDDSMEAEFVAACKRAIEAHCRGGVDK